jgi:hypothetical protein
VGNYVDPEAVRPPAAIGPCTCPGTPHHIDYVTVVRQFGYGAKGAMRRTFREGGVEAYNQAVLLHGIKAWTLVLPDGKPRPVNADQIAALDEPTVERLLSDDLVGAAFTDIEDDPPNGSSAPSDSGSQGSAGSTQTTPAPEPSTTS